MKKLTLSLLTILLLSGFIHIYKFYNSIYNKIRVIFSKKIIEDTHYNPLSPTDNAEDCDIYIKSIDWALKNKKTIKNIAISGSYGSGKSSIINTFIKQYECSENLFKCFFFPKYKFLKISLATFKDSQKKAVDNDNLNNIELQRLIELSILQQFFFHEKDSQIPDSRFKRIKRQKKCKLVIYSIGIILLLASLLYLLAPSCIEKATLLTPSNKYLKIIHYSALAISIIGLFFIIYKSSRSLIGLSIKKLNINNAEIEIDNGISKSILNNHFDEIIYFFEATKYNVVIIEDLDRFEQTEVFTKLREINLLINSSNKIKRAVVFIYAIKDDMFLDKDRTKFFDFIIPIISHIDFSNSGDKLRTIIKQNKYQVSEELIDDLSMFIDDMRLLYNIMNEFYIYSKKIESDIDHNKLLSMIVYKNIFPNDFTLLSQNAGDLFKIISKKTEYIKEEIAILDRQIADLKTKITQADENQLSDIVELRIIYLSKIIEKINNTGQYPFFYFVVNSNRLSINDFAKSDQFDFYQNSCTYCHNPQYSGYERSFQYNAVNIEKEINPNLTYKQREDIVLNKTITNKLKKEIEKNNEQKNIVQKSKLKNLLLNKQISIDTDSDKKSDLINILLRNGYIDENYINYISIFHEGALTKSDYQFLINVKTEKLTEFNYKLIKTPELLKKINEYAFEKEYVLNFDLVDAILLSANSTTKKKRLFEQLCNVDEFTIKFIDEYIEITPHIELFISELCNHWTEIWNFIKTESFYSDERKELYFKLIIQYADELTHIDIFEDDKDYLNNYSEFLNINTDVTRLEMIIEGLELKFKSINLDSPESLLEFIYKNNFYSINIEMISIILNHKKVYDSSSFENMNYTYITTSNLKYLINYIESNIEEYIESVYLKLGRNTDEKIDIYEKLLNNEELSLNKKEKIIIKVNTIIENLSNIKSSSVCDLLLEYSKVEPTWENILVSFELNENKLNQSVVDYINSPSNAEALSKLRMSPAEVSEKQIFNELSTSIIHESRINLDSYKLLIKSIPWRYQKFDVEKISIEKVVILIENNKVSPIIKSYLFLKENFARTNILFLEKYLGNQLDLTGDILLDSTDLELILKSVKIQNTYKFSFINTCEEEIILQNPENAKIVVELFVANENTYDIKDSLKLSLLKNKNVPIVNRLLLFNKSILLVNYEIIEEFLISLGGAYKEITEKNKKATLENNARNRILLKKLIKLEFISSVSEIEKGLRVNHHKKKE